MSVVVVSRAAPIGSGCPPSSVPPVPVRSTVAAAPAAVMLLSYQTPGVVLVDGANVVTVWPAASAVGRPAAARTAP